MTAKTDEYGLAWKEIADSRTRLEAVVSQDLTAATQDERRGLEQLLYDITGRLREAAHLIEKEPDKPPLLPAPLPEAWTTRKRSWKIDHVIRTVEAEYGVERIQERQYSSGYRKAKRHAIYQMFHLIPMSRCAIALEFHDNDVGAVIHAIRQHWDAERDGGAAALEIVQLRRKILAQAGEAVPIGA